MTASTEEEYFTSKHAKLDNIAAAANTFAWIALVSQILYMGARFIQIQNSYNMQAIWINSTQPSFMEMLRQDAVYTFSLIVDIASIFIRGVIYWLVLKGIASGLDMIVETDLNYRDEPAGVTNENPPEFYDPPEVIRLEKWLPKAAIVAIIASIVSSAIALPQTQRIVLSYFMGNPEKNFVAWLITIVIFVFGVGFQSIIIYYPFKTLGSILKILMEMEFNSRGVAKTKNA